MERGEKSAANVWTYHFTNRHSRKVFHVAIKEYDDQGDLYRECTIIFD
jgi:hypothetical protein